ncbi:hypothetical protein NDU88_001865 [Pleurodeles waltl]|uniref:Uncharacterized protein n=1 Tax=Pleurodeles waltl TaxID=8319 RepID=A0AAV7MLK4_PLEWA|nr:hypothetical protein NDU88_001865 [Pleurodeles waltl]
MPQNLLQPKQRPAVLEAPLRQGLWVGLRCGSAEPLGVACIRCLRSNSPRSAHKAVQGIRCNPTGLSQCGRGTTECVQGRLPPRGRGLLTASLIIAPTGEGAPAVIGMQ